MTRAAYVALLTHLANHTGPTGLLARGLLGEVDTLHQYTREWPTRVDAGTALTLTFARHQPVLVSLYQRPEIPEGEPHGPRPSHLAVVFDPPLARQSTRPEGAPWTAHWGSFRLPMRPPGEDHAASEQTHVQPHTGQGRDQRYRRPVWVRYTFLHGPLRFGERAAVREHALWLGWGNRPGVHR